MTTQQRCMVSWCVRHDGIRLGRCASCHHENVCLVCLDSWGHHSGGCKTTFPRMHHMDRSAHNWGVLRLYSEMFFAWRITLMPPAVWYDVSMDEDQMTSVYEQRICAAWEAEDG